MARRGCSESCFRSLSIERSGDCVIVDRKNRDSNRSTTRSPDQTMDLFSRMWQAFEYPLNPFSTERDALTTDLPLSECLARLGESLRSDQIESERHGDGTGSVSGLEVEGSTGPSSFTIHQHSPVRNLLRTEALGRLIAARQGTRIVIEFGPSRGARWFAAAALAFSAFISVVLVLRWRHDPASEWSGYSLPFAALFPPFIYGYLAASRWLTRNEAPQLLWWVRHLLDAKPLNFIE